MSDRIHNFSAGPAALPEEVLKRAQKDLVNYQGEGLSIMEMSHRSKTFASVLEKAKQGLISLLDIPDTHEVLFLQGGASLQFSMIPMNLVSDNKSIDVINTGSWTKKAIKEFKKITTVNELASSADKNFSYIPSFDDLSFNTDAAYAYITSNNTIAGTQYHAFPKTPTPLVADMSSDILSRPLDIGQFGLIFAGAQKNIGPSGVTVVIIRKDLIKENNALPSMLSYQVHADNNSLYNTAPTFGIYMIQLVVEWLQERGGLAAMQRQNEEKAAALYEVIDQSSLYTSPVNKASRSLMNVVFRVNNDEDLEAAFLKGAIEKNLSGLKGHRSVGGLRASIYNACPVESVDALINYMKEFEKR